MPGVSTAQVARRYAMNANLLFKWLRDPAYEPDVTGGDQGLFLPVEVSDGPPLMLARVALPRSDQDDQLNSTPAGRVEITTPSGFRVTIDGNFDSEAVGLLLKALAS